MFEPTLRLFTPFSFGNRRVVEKHEYHQKLVWCAESRFRAALIAMRRQSSLNQAWMQSLLQKEYVSEKTEDFYILSDHLCSALLLESLAQQCALDNRLMCQSL